LASRFRLPSLRFSAATSVERTISWGVDRLVAQLDVDQPERGDHGLQFVHCKILAG
jgi:hypothetical protein